MRAGALRHNIFIYKDVITKNALSESVKERVLFKEVRADKKSLGGDEIVKNEQLTPISQVLFTIRFDEEIDENMTIGYDGKFYNIRYIESFRNSYTKITCSKIK